jgi:hypothetical protein
MALAIGLRASQLGHGVRSRTVTLFSRGKVIQIKAGPFDPCIHGAA